ncbi:hypothetical protein SAMN05519105_0585 [Rhodobacter sp. 24-YEA-8]|nr:hypothetical protein SAMN05519105_0585 [Rhodobacter sp. 24-YEA-8]
MRLLLSIIFSLFAMPGFAQSCSASNDVGDQCSISCATGQAAQCRNGSGASAPVCECVSSLLSEPDATAQSEGASIHKANGNAAIPSEPRVHVNVASSLSKELSSLKDFDISQSCRSEVVGERCEPDMTPCSDVTKNIGPAVWLFACAPRQTICALVYGQVCYPVLGKLTIGGPLIVVSGPSVSIEEPNWEGIPAKIMGMREVYTNCTPRDQTFTYTHSERWITGARETKGRSLTVGREENVTVKTGAKYEAYGFGVNGEVQYGIKWSSSSSSSSGEEFNHQSEVSDTRSMPVEVPQMSRLIIEHYWSQRVVPFRYKGSIVVDAPLSSNLSGKSLASQVLPEAARTFSFSGVISDSLIIEGNTFVASTELSNEFCSVPRKGVVRETFDSLDKSVRNNAVLAGYSILPLQ